MVLSDPGRMPIEKATIRKLLAENSEHDCSDGGGNVCVRISAIADLPTIFGDFQVISFHSPSDRKEHAALVRGDPIGQEHVPVRMHSECLTGDALGSLRCDCRDQLEQSLKEIGQRELGVVLYLRQEGRGIGFENKIRAYQLQEEGLDTIEANQALGFRPDERDYEVAAHMLGSLGIRSIVLMSNNPAKIADLKYHGVSVEGRIPIIVPPNPHNLRYLQTKRAKAGHLLPAWVQVTEQVDSASDRDGASSNGAPGA